MTNEHIHLPPEVKSQLEHRNDRPNVVGVLLSIKTMEAVKASPKLSALADRTRKVCTRLIQSPQFAPVLLAAILVWEFGDLLFGASKKLLWYDELLTFHVSGLQPFSVFWRALKAGADGMPLGYYLLVRLVRILPGDPLVTLRLPSIVGYLMTLLAVYWFARKRLPAFAGLAAVFLTTLSPFRGYAIEARSYALLVGFLAIAAVLWQRIDEKRFMTPLFALFLTLVVAFHYLAVVALAPFGIAELVWTLRSRRIRWRVWATCVLATAPFFISLPIIQHYKDLFGKNFWSQSSWGMLLSTYGFYAGLDTPWAVFLFTLVLIAFLWLVVDNGLLPMWQTTREGSPNENNFTPPEVVLFSGFLCFPALLIVLTKLLHSGYTPRYGWPAILGLVWGSVYLVRTIWLKSFSIYLLVALMIAFAYQGVSDVRKLSKARSSTIDERWISLAELSRSEPGIPVVIGSPIVYLEAAEYAPPELRDRIVDVVDEYTAARLVHADTADRTNRLLSQFIPLHVEDRAAFQAAHQKFILRSDGNFDWFTEYVLEQKFHMRLLSRDTWSSLYIAER
ncbi:MAG TPA: glycosyltransferase family 39 protein [Bryobacteraceae bacterium]|jgi:hypothetical protein|nr:glycosyltransferase family 39 protein [Bryobacteraceae bacterium]